MMEQHTQDPLINEIKGGVVTETTEVLPLSRQEMNSTVESAVSTKFKTAEYYPTYDDMAFTAGLLKKIPYKLK